MTSVTDVCNRMLQRLGTRTTVTDAELAANSTNEAIQFNLMYTELRDDLLRMAPWNCAMKTANAVYVTSSPGTPENTSSSTTLWSPGQPSPPWSYEYQYPLDCLMPRWIIPSTQTGFAGGVPITTAVTGGASSYWWGQPIRFKVQQDAFYTVSAIAVNAGGIGYAVGDTITLVIQLSTQSITNQIATFNGGAPQGAPAQVQVTTVAAGVITGVKLINVLNGEANAYGGSYYYDYSTTIGNGAVPQGSTTGAGTGATFALTFQPPAPQRVILTNQEFATLAYTQQVTDPNLFDPSFRAALYDAGAASLTMALKGDKALANQFLEKANRTIFIARGSDGNEGLTINDVTPDWIRVRGWAGGDGMYSGPYQGYDWGNGYAMY